jgi:RNA polymerase sigma-70 factor, ECF subfamily
MYHALALDVPEVGFVMNKSCTAVRPSVIRSRARQVRIKAMTADPATWVEKYGDYLFRYALMRVRNREQAENMVQETFLAALQARSSFRGKSSEKTWMVGILKHKIIDQFRKSIREKSVTELQSDDEQTIDQFYDKVGQPKQYPREWMPDPAASFHSKEFWQVFRSCLSELPERTANVFILRELEGQTTEEICKELGITPTNLWVMLHRARLQLRAGLEKQWFEKKNLHLQ